MTNLDKTPAHIRDTSLDLRELADDIEQLIRERDEARAEIERLTRELDEERGRDDVIEAHRKLGETLMREGALRCEVDRLRTTVPRVITPDELREGQIVVVWESGAWPQPVGDVIQIRSIEHLDDGSIDLRAPGECCNFNPHDEQAVLLAAAPADPEPEPWEPQRGDIGIVTHFRGRALDEPVAARLTGLSWYRLDRRNWPDEAPNAGPREVTVTRAKVVPDE
ncbi:hypothetical protein [Nesterenkonia sp. HG001]|uniref:hypothetical protein n=1 Tax=Nesterenkonia sp. HG001 TaxID=2983207 RepID=UPI002AC7C0B6|nr:hypothetical protein [Nesterenkonia sp. HG001]MDZ5076759.1 hypothetical protein [Nesterenkonia sp. HG001]